MITKPLSKYLRIFVFGFILLFLFYKNIGYMLNYKNSIDMFHLGEKISPSLGLMIFGKKSITDIFVLHGYFLEVWESIIAFRFFGIAIGSYLFFEVLLISISYFLFFFLLNKLIKNDLIFISACLFFVGTHIRLRIANNLIFLLFLLVSIHLLKNKSSSILLIFQSFLVFFNFLYAIEQAYYGLLFLFVFMLIKFSFLKFFKKKLPVFNYFLSYIVGFLIFFLVGVLILGISGLKQYYHDLFFIPKLGYMLFSQNYPPLSFQFFYPYYLPFLIVFSNILFIAYALLKRELKNIASYLFIFLLGLSYFISIFARADLRFISYDISNINFFLWPLFVSTFMVMDFTIQKSKIITQKILVFFILLVQILPFFNYKNFVLKNFQIKNIINFINLPKYSDSFWLSKEQQNVVNFIKNNTSKNDYIYVFNDESLYYYLTQRNNPTKYYLAILTEPTVTQRSVIDRLKKYRPKYIVYHSSYWSNKIDEIPQSARLYMINSWLLKNYRHSTKIGSTTLLF